MKETTIKRLKENGKIVIGRYTYKLNYNTGDILRCLTEKIGFAWIGFDGERHDGWEVVDHL